MNLTHQKHSIPTTPSYLTSFTFWALVLLMIATRYHQQGLTIADATLAVFFAVGFYFQSYRTIPILLVVAFAVDIAAIWLGGVSAACLSIAYVMLIPAYICGWLGGRFAYHVFYRYLPIVVKAIGIAACIIIAALLCEIFASGSFYVWSGVFTNPTFEGLINRLILYFPTTFTYFIAYIALFITLHYAIRYLSPKLTWKTFRSERDA